MTVYCRTDAEPESGIDGDNIEDDSDILQNCT
jgi:hypothetical protein